MRSARYTFGGNADGKRNRSGNLLFSSARGAPCADSSKPFWETGCRYDTRYYRDFVKNFIARHGARQRLEDETSSINRTRFLVYYAPHATHQKRSAPDQTLAHYEKASLSTTANVRPLFPGHPQNFWAALEEVDAAVGQILGVIEGFCEVPMAPRCAGGGPLAGCAAQSVFSPTGSTDAVPKVKTCTTNSDCGTAKCVRNLRDRTLVLFTADQGTEGSTYGEPWLRGGKGSTYEGGIRVGLTAWSGADLAVGADETTFGAGRMAEQDLGSQVDLFPTIAHAAGCRPTADDKLGFKLKLCDNKKLVPCTSVGSVCASGGTCVERTLEGRSLLPVISPSVRASYAAKNIDAVDRRRNLAYVRWNTPKDPDLAVSSRQGYFADDGGCIGDYCEGAKAAAKVCSYEGEADPVPGVDPYDTTSAIARTRRGGSCEVCATNPENPEQDPDAECKNKNCKVNGLFCVPDDVRRTNCAGAAPHLCFPTEYARCSKNNSASPNECGSNHWCMEVVTKCTTCGDAAWKLSKLDNLTDYELFDLASNPEESKRLNCLEDLAYQPQSSSLRAVRDHLHGKLSAWKEAVTANPTSNGRAEP